MDILETVRRYFENFGGDKGVIGYSERGRELCYIQVKKTEYPVIIAQYSIHAREYVTAYLCLKQIDKFISDGVRGNVFFIPVANPDGVDICVKGDPLYKANARGVDLNVNFDADWGKGAANVFIPGKENYVGEYPFSESETRALRDFTVKIKPDATLSYHTKGEEIYWKFGQTGEAFIRDKAIAEALAESTGYKAKIIGGSSGGYKDWCIKALGIPAFTIEAGYDGLTHPIDEKYVEEIFLKNGNVLNVLTEKLCTN